MDDIFESVFSSVNAFVYRCRNDDAYTMETMQGRVQDLTGYRSDEVLGNVAVSYVELTIDEDKERVFAEVDAAIEAKQPWDVSYRLRHKLGHEVWVRERGNAIYKDGTLVFLEGLVVGAEAEFKLNSKLQTTLMKTSTTNQEIVAMSEKITSSVRELSMLSVNARIEAARSGEAGLGFAIVANEIKTLADRNADWAHQISQKIKSASA